MTPVQARVLKIIRDLTTSDGVTPSIREIKTAMGAASVGSVMQILDVLERDGKITRTGGARGIALVAGPYHPLTLETLPSDLLGHIRDQCLSVLAARKARGE